MKELLPGGVPAEEKRNSEDVGNLVQSGKFLKRRYKPLTYT